MVIIYTYLCALQKIVQCYCINLHNIVWFFFLKILYTGNPHNPHNTLFNRMKVFLYYTGLFQPH